MGASARVKGRLRVIEKAIVKWGSARAKFRVKCVLGCVKVR